MSDTDNSATIDELRDQILAAQDGQADLPPPEGDPVEADTPEITVTIAEVAAAAIVSLETIAMILNEENAAKVIAEYERRAEQFRSSAESATT